MRSIPNRPCLLTPTTPKVDRPLFVFLPGLDGTGQLLRLQTESLSGYFDVRCLALPPQALMGWETLAEEVTELIEGEIRRNPHRPVYLCGESFGGCLAMQVAVRSPQVFDRLILINPASSFRNSLWIRWGAQITPWLPEPLYRASTLALLPFLSALGQIEAGDRQALLEAIQSVPQQTSVWRLALLRDFDLGDLQLRRIRQPALILASAGDRLLPSIDEANRLVHCLRDARMHILPNSGHTCLLEANVRLFDILAACEFLDAPKSSMAASC
ncbi:alpha/beta fold hydrolase [Geitlerinema sp. PCC 7407]|uniref:alpha/beta fold hydrolase n=1 Tax=Geitlerinema sp. PCC 7407 TaxID=1173025 RepID=UPI00029F8374|nr:alpha/beta hydrolase [Geitlerinema sp. PCC 7407]AFY65206.1 alpha/beta hydrolase fold protein [Geitlerinema sp. PCC 7407]